MIRQVIQIGHDVWLYSAELRRGWLKVTEMELNEAVDCLDEHGDLPLDEYDNWNIGMDVLEDRRFKSIANYLEGTGP